MRFTPRPFAHPAVTALLAAFFATYRYGGALFAAFMVSEERTYHSLPWYHAGSPAGDRIHLGALLRSDALAHALPELPEDPLTRPEPALDFRDLRTGLVCEAELMDALLGGGATAKFPGSVREAKAMADDFCTALFEERYREVFAVLTGPDWSTWFHPRSWTHTWVIIDEPRSHLWLLGVTDTDQPPGEGRRAG